MVENRLSKKICKLELAEWIVILMSLTYSIVFSYYTIMRHYSFRSNAWDLGILTQSVASAVKGELFRNNVELYFSPTGSYLGIHFSPILFTLIPFFYLIPRVETLLVIQSIALGIGAIPVYLISKLCLSNRLTALIISATYLLNPSLQGINWYDVHTQAFFPSAILFALYFLKKKKYLLYFLFILMALATMEQSVFLVALLIPHSIWEIRRGINNKDFSKNRVKHFSPLIIFLIVILAWMAISTYVKNSINPNPPLELKAIANYRILGIRDPAEIPVKALTHPELALKALRFDLTSKILYIMLTFAPSCFLAFLSPLALLPSFLWIFLALLSNWPPYYQLGYQYSAFTVPFVTLATIEALQKIVEDLNNVSLERFLFKIATILLITGIILSLFTSPISFIYKPLDFSYFRDYGISTPSPLEKEVLKLLEQIPEEATILTTATIFPHISTRIGAYVIPPQNVPSKRLFESHLTYLKSIEYDYIFITYFWDKNEADLIYKNFLKDNDLYGLFIEAPGLELYKRGYKREPTKLPIRLTYRELFETESVIVDDPSSETGRIILLNAAEETGRYAWYGPYITLVPGRYIVKFRLKVDSLPNGKILKLDVWSNSLKTRIAFIDLYKEDFIRPSIWHTFTLTFSIDERVTEVEFRGLEVTSNVSIFLDYIEVEPL